MNDDPPEYIEIEDGHVVVTEDAPEQFREDFRNNPGKYQAIVSFGFALAASDLEDEKEYDIVDASELANRERQLMDAAVEDGDVEAAQRHQTLANTFDSAWEDYSRSLTGGKHD